MDSQPAWMQRSSGQPGDEPSATWADAGSGARAGGAGRSESTVRLRPCARSGGSTGTLVPGAAGANARARAEVESLEPRGAGEILDTAFELLRARFAACVGLSAALWTAPLSIEAFGTGLFQRSLGVSAVAGLFAPLAVQGFAIALVTTIVYDAMQGRATRTASAVRRALARAPALILTIAVCNLAIAVGTLLFLVPGVLLAWLLTAVPAVLVLEGARPLDALQRSAHLVRNSFGRYLATAACQTVLVLPCVGLVELAAQPQLAERAWLSSGLSEGAFRGLVLILSAALSGLATAFSSIVHTVFYLDCRIRTEGFDLVMRLERVRERARRATP